MNLQSTAAALMFKRLKKQSEKAVELFHSLGEDAFVEKWKTIEEKKTRAIFALAYVGAVYHQGNLRAILETPGGKEHLGTAIMDLADHFGLSLNPEEK